MADDDLLLSRLRQGDAQALAALLDQYRQPLLAYINSQLGTKLRRKVEADDILQEVGAEAIRQLAAHKPLPDNPEAPGLVVDEPFSWFCQMAQRRIIDAHRRLFGAQKRSGDREVALDAGASRGVGLIHLLVASMTSPSQAVSRDMRCVRMYDALGTLPEDQREVLKLRYIEGLASKDVADRIGKSDGAVRVMLSRALGKLRSMLEEGEG